MLSPAVIKSSSQASHYFFEQDNYYFKDIAEQEGLTAWWGKGAEKLGLEGTVDREKFQALLSGELPSGEKLGRMVDGERQHRPGFDLTFSAPKSVSLLALVGGDKRLDTAHENAVNTALSAIETACAQARVVGKDGEMKFQNTRNLVVAQFKHDTSRDLDPQRHTHCVVMNMTERQDGKFRALASQPNQKSSEGVNGFLERVFEHKNYFGMIYRSQLAYEVQKLGYKVEVTGHQSLFEITGVDKEALKHFSKRRQDIEASLEQKGFDSAKAAAAATLDTRKAKNNATDREKLHAFWEKEAETLGVDFKKIVENTHQKAQGDTTDQMTSEVAKKAVQSALEHQSTFNIKINHHALVKSALHFSLGEVRPADILKEVDSLQASGQLLSINEKDNTFYTTKKLLTHEQKIIDTIKEAKTRKSSVNINEAGIEKANVPNVHKEKLQAWINDPSAVKLMTGASTKDNTAFIQSMVNVFEHNGLTVRVLSPRSDSSAFISENVERKPSNLWQWLVNQNKPELGQTVSKFLHIAEKDMGQLLGKVGYRKHVVMVDSSEKLGINDMDRLLTIQKQTGMQVIFMGDEKAKGGVTASDAMSLLKMSQATHIDLRETTKKEIPAPELHFSEQAQQSVRHETIAKDFARLTVKERQESFVFAPTRKAQEALNKTIHETLHNKSKEWSVQTLVPVAMTDTERKFAKSYEVGTQIRFNDDYRKIGVAKGEYATVVASYERRNVVRINTARGEFDWKVDSLSSQHEVYRKETRTFSVGETVVFNRKINELEINKNTHAQIEAITDNKITLKTDRKTINLSKHDPVHLDYGYVKTLNDSIVTSKANVFVDLPSQSGSSQAIYQVAEQSKENLRLYTDNFDKLTKNLNRDDKKMTGIDTVIQSASVTRFINDETVGALKSDIEKAMSILTKNNASQEVDAVTKAVNFAVEKLTSRDAGFTHKVLVGEAIAFGFGKVSSSEIQQSIAEKRKNGELIMGKHFNGETRWTTQEAINLEKNILQTMHEGEGKTTPLVSKTAFKAIMENTTLTTGQYAACELISTTKDRFVLIQGYAGTGKSTSLQTLKEKILDTAHERGETLTLKTLAPSHRAVSELREKGLDAQTLQSFIPEYENSVKQGKKVDHSNTVFILDEASMVNNNDWFKFSKIMNETNARVVATLGDKAQLSSVGSGKPFELAQKAGFPMAEMTDIVRQKTPELLSAVKSIIAGKYEQAFESIDKVNPETHITRAEKLEMSHSIVEISKKQEEKGEQRPTEIAKDYVTRTPDVRENTLIISHTHKGRKAINEAIQHERLERGELQSDTSQNVNILRAENLTPAELQHAKHYSPDMVLRFNRDIPSIGVEKNTYWTIKDNDQENNVLTLNHRDDPKKLVIFEPERMKKILEHGLEVYKPESVNLHKDEMIRFTRRDKESDINANDTGVITGITDKNITIAKGDKTFTLDKEKTPLHLDLGYTTTGYGAQGMTSRYIITDEASYLKHLSNQRSFYVAISRGQVHATIYTDNQSALLHKIKQNAGDKLAALEVTGEINKLSAMQPTQKVKPVLQEHYDAKKIESALSINADDVARQLLGDPNQHLSSGKNLRYGKKGSLSINLAGEKRGLWHNFETGEHGNMLTLIQKTANIPFIEALKMGAKMVGEQGDMPTFTPQKQSTHKPDEPQKTSEFAERLAKESLPIEGTLAERYLREHRAISNIDKGIDLRFHPAVQSSINEKTLPALLAVGHNKEGKVQTVQAIYLDEATGNKAKDIPLNKQTFGSPSGASVLLTKNHDKAAISFIAEGTETGMSIAQAMPEQDVQVTLGISNFNHIDPKKTADVIVLCLDNDGDNSKTAKTILQAGERLVNEGKQVWVVKPDEAKTDFNDLLKKEGLLGVSEKLNDIRPFKEFRDLMESELKLKDDLDKLNPKDNLHKFTDKKGSASDEMLFKMAEHAHEKENKSLKEFLFSETRQEIQKSVESPVKIPAREKGFEREI
jgi:conjugative transfer relaxase protein TraI